MTLISSKTKPEMFLEQKVEAENEQINCGEE